MTKYIFLFLLISAGIMVPVDSIASNIHSHTNTSIELKPIFPPTNSYQTASVCFLGVGDCDPNIGHSTGDDDMDTDETQQCLNAGFTRKTCNTAQAPIKDCAHDSSFVTGCECKEDLISCPRGQVGSGPSCDGKYVSCQCDPNLLNCTSPKFGEGATCGGRYEKCTCPATVILSQANDRCTQTCDGKCIAKTCDKTSNETGCSYGTETCSDGCGGSRQCCKSAPPCNSSHPSWCPTHGSCHGDCCRDGSIASCDTRCGGSGCYTPPPPPPANPWRYIRSNCRSLMCWDCLNQQYCGSYYQTGYAPVYTCDNHCVNTSTGEKKFICSLGGYGIFSAKAATKAQCQSNMVGLTPPSGEADAGSCNADGTTNCHY